MSKTAANARPCRTLRLHGADSPFAQAFQPCHHSDALAPQSRRETALYVAPAGLEKNIFDEKKQADRTMAEAELAASHGDLSGIASQVLRNTHGGTV